MIRLTRVELRRMTARRMIQLAAVAVAAIVALGLFGTWQHLSEATSDQPEALAAYEQARREWEQHGPAMLEQCLADQEADREQSGDPDIDYGCADMEPRPEHFLMVAQPRDQAAHGLLTGAGFPVLFLAFAIGATATAAEFTHRTMGTWLTFEPRRTRVLGSKLLAAALGTLPLGIGFVVLVVLGTAALYGIFDVGETVPSGLAAGAVTWTSVRLAGLTAVAGLGGAAGGMLLRHTGAVLGVLIGDFIAMETVLAPLFPGLTRWTLTLNVEAWVSGGAARSLWECSPNGECTEIVVEVGQLQAGLYLAGLTALVAALAWARFRTSDID